MNSQHEEIEVFDDEQDQQTITKQDSSPLPTASSAQQSKRARSDQQSMVQRGKQQTLTGFFSNNVFGNVDPQLAKTSENNNFGVKSMEINGPTKVHGRKQKAQKAPTKKKGGVKNVAFKKPQQ